MKKKDHTLEKKIITLLWFLCLVVLHYGTIESLRDLHPRLFILQYANDLTVPCSLNVWIKRPHTDVVQYRCNPRVQVSKLSHRPSLSKISLIFWTCSAGRIRY